MSKVIALQHGESGWELKARDTRGFPCMMPAGMPGVVVKPFIECMTAVTDCLIYIRSFIQLGLGLDRVL